MPPPVIKNKKFSLVTEFVTLDSRKRVSLRDVELMAGFGFNVYRNSSGQFLLDPIFVPVGTRRRNSAAQTAGYSAKPAKSVRPWPHLPVRLLELQKQPMLTPEQHWQIVRDRSVGAEAELLAEEGGILSLVDFTQKLNLASRQTVSNYLSAKKIFAVRRIRKLGYPAWLIHKGALLNGLSDVLTVLENKNIDPLGIVLFFLTSVERCGNKRPLDLLRSGSITEAVMVAESVGEHGN